MKNYIFSALLLTTSLAQSCNQHALTLKTLNTCTRQVTNSSLSTAAQSLDLENLEVDTLELEQEEELIKSFADVFRYFFFFTLRSAISN